MLQLDDADAPCDVIDAEATGWLERPHHADATLAELFALRAGREPAPATEDTEGGFYL